MKGLEKLFDCSVEVSPSDESLDDGSVRINFSESSSLRADYWRLIKANEALISSFDHKQRYGLPSPVNAVDWLKLELAQKLIQEARLDVKTGDLLFEFTGETMLQVFNFTSYEVWELTFSSGGTEYSNRSK